MTSIRSYSLLFIFIFTFSLIASCSRQNNNFEREARRSVRDGVISQEEWDNLSKLAQDLSEFQNEHGVFSPALLKTYLIDDIKDSDNTDSCLKFDVDLFDDVNTSEPIKVKFYLERSGSMVPYDAPQTKGTFKKALTTLLNSVPTSENNANELMYVVNDGVYPFNKNFKEFIVCKDIFEETKGVGDPRYTDFSCIFDSIISRTAQNELSIFASDLIYSTKEMANVNPAKILNEAEALTTTVFKSHPNKDVTIIKLIGDFYGKYYTYKSPSEGVEYHGNRPYYIMLVADPSVMNRVMTDNAFKDFRDFENLEGFENYYCFSPTKLNPSYSVISDYSEYNRGRIKESRDKADRVGKEIHGIGGFDADRDDVRTFTLAVDLSGVRAPEQFKINTDNYILENTSDFSIDKIIPITGKERQYTSITRRVPTATHLFVISSDKKNIKNETMQLTLKNALPEWMVKTGTDDDTHLNDRDFSETTFAFTQMMKGLYKSFFPSSENNTYFTIPIKIKK